MVNEILFRISLTLLGSAGIVATLLPITYKSKMRTKRLTIAIISFGISAFFASVVVSSILSDELFALTTSSSKFVLTSGILSVLFYGLAVGIMIYHSYDLLKRWEWEHQQERKTL